MLLAYTNSVESHQLTNRTNVEMQNFAVNKLTSPLLYIYKEPCRSADTTYSIERINTAHEMPCNVMSKKKPAKCCAQDKGLIPAPCMRSACSVSLEE